MLKHVIAVLVVGLVAVAAQAADYNLGGYWVDVEFWTGSGPNETVVVIDWNENGGSYTTETHAFGYRWDNATDTVADALTAIDATVGIAIDGIPESFIQDITYADGIDSHTAGARAGWWCLGDSVDGGANWTLNGGGIGGEILGNNKIEGLNLANGEYAWSMDGMVVPTPEPATMIMLAAGGMALLRRRK